LRTNIARSLELVAAMTCAPSDEVKARARSAPVAREERDCSIRLK
jgi:hypothetical protein